MQNHRANYLLVDSLERHCDTDSPRPASQRCAQLFSHCTPSIQCSHTKSPHTAFSDCPMHFGSNRVLRRHPSQLADSSRRSANRGSVRRRRNQRRRINLRPVKMSASAKRLTRARRSMRLLAVMALAPLPMASIAHHLRDCGCFD